MKKLLLLIAVLLIAIAASPAQQLINNPTYQGTAQSDQDLGAHALKNGTLGTGFTAPWAKITGAPTSAAAYGITNGTVIDTWGTKTPPAGSLVIASGKTLTSSNTLTLAGTDGTTMTFPATSSTLATTGSNTFTGTQSYGAQNLTGTSWNIAGATGVLTAAGLGTTPLDATKLTGAVADARLSANVALLNGTNTWSNPQIFTVPTTLGSARFTAVSVGWYRIWNNITDGGPGDGSKSNIEFKVYAMAATGDFQSIFDVQWTDNIFKQFGTPLPVGVIHSEYYTNQAVTQIRTCVEGIDIFVAAPNTAIAVTPISDPAGMLAGNFQFTPTSTVLATYNLPRRGSITLADLSVSGNLILPAAGNGLQIKEGTNARSGTATLAAGTVTVSNTSVTASTRFVLTPHGTTIAAVGISAQTAGTSFVIKSASGTDTNHVDWQMWEPAP